MLDWLLDHLVIRDPLEFFRLVLGVIVTVYFTVITAQSIWGWYLYLAGRDKQTLMLRRYLLVQALRLRFRTFWGDVLVCVLLMAAFLLLWRAQNRMDEIGDTLRSAAHVAKAA